jgi:hypothetical protein
MRGIKNERTLYVAFRFCKEDIVISQGRLVITGDYPGTGLVSYLALPCMDLLKAILTSLI